ncbi:hypothetical protein [Desulfothermobacter acidiphilus]|uniref:hypothetical protein n=1 Tax=Desulfothermobacter acidiphilus TaxID=1938353 RepID=UPI003F8ADC5F
MAMGLHLEAGVPYVGPLAVTLGSARRLVTSWIRCCGLGEESLPVRAFLLPRLQGQYELVLWREERSILRLPGLDEFLVWRLLRAARRQGVMVLTPLVGENKTPLALLEGAGLILQFRRGEKR